MLQQNTHAIQRLHARIRDAASSHFRTSLFLDHRSPTYIPYEIQYTPLDYSDSEQCDDILDNLYVVNGLYVTNTWHGFGDLLLPLTTLMHDPCFSPLNVNMDLIIGTEDRNYTYFWDASSAPSTEQCSSSSSSSWSLPQHATHCSSSSYIPYRDAYIMSSFQTNPDIFTTGYQFFLSQHSVQDADERVFPHISHIEEIPKSRILCIKDAIIGMPWYYQIDGSAAHKVDSDRSEWEKHRLNGYLLYIESILIAASSSIHLTHKRADYMVPYSKYQKLKLLFVKQLQSLGVVMEDTQTGTTPLSKSQWFTDPIIPVGTKSDVINHEEWLSQHPSYLDAALNDPYVRRTRKRVQAETGSAYVSDRGRPFNDEELHSYVNHEHRLRLRIISRTSRLFVNQSVLIRTAQDIGFDVTVQDFSRMTSVTGRTQDVIQTCILQR